MPAGWISLREVPIECYETESWVAVALIGGHPEPSSGALLAKLFEVGGQRKSDEASGTDVHG